MNDVQQDDKTMAMIAHLLGIVSGFIGALVIWLINKDKADKAFVIDQSKEALNFQITLLIGYIIGIVLSFIVIGVFLNLALMVANLVLCIMAGMKANNGESYRYPFALRLIK